MGNLVSGLFGGDQASSQHIRYPFGQLPLGIAQQLQGAFIGPLLSQLGFGGGTEAKQQQRTDRLASAQGPLADFIRQVQGLAPQVGPEAQAAGNRISAVGSDAFTSLQSQIQNLLGTLPASEAAGTQALGEAQQYGRTAYGPESMDPYFRVATERALQPIRSDFAARGLGDSGAAYQAEQAQRSQLSEDFASQQLGMQQQAPGLIGQAAGINPSLAGLGVQGAGDLLGAVPGLAQALSAQFQLPMQSLGGLMQLLSGGTPLAANLLGQTAPVFTTQSGKASPFSYKGSS